MSDPAPQRDAVLAALERVLAWSEIARSPQLAKFLDYIVRRTLDGDEQSIKAYSIAVDVLGRSADFDPQADPIVRVQARRLRALLDDYYRGPGQAETIRISLPVGRYVPEFAASDGPIIAPSAPTEGTPPANRMRGGGITISWFVLCVIAAAIAATAAAINTWGPRPQSIAADADAVRPPSVTIVEFQNLAGPEIGGPMVAGLAIELVTDLEQFEDIDVRYGGGGEGDIAVTDLPASDYMLTGIVRPDGLVVQYSAILTDSVSGSVLWNHTIPVPAQESLAPDVLDHVSRLFSLILGSPRGPLHAAARQLLAADLPLDGGVNPYLCRVLFDLYRETGMATEAERASDCIASLSQTEQQSGIGLAMAAALALDLADPATTADQRADRLRIAQLNLDRAIVLSPLSAFVWEQHARLREANGEFVAARTDYGSSIQLNPANADALAAYARLLALGGNLTDAEAMAVDAENTPYPPAWYHGVPALLALRDAEYSHAIHHAELYAQADRELGPVLAILAGQGAGQGDVVNRYLPQVLDMASFRARGVLPTLQQRIEDDALLNRIRTGLLAAGVPPDALVAGF